MSEELTKYDVSSIEKVWNNPEEIKALVAPQLSQQEFSYFMGLSLSTGMNPLTREIWAVKYKEGTPAQIFIGRDGYRRTAQELEEYDGHTAAAIYENDTFQVENGIPHHTFSFQNRGRVMGAYCVVYVKGRVVPFLEVVDVREYDTGKSLWSTKKGTMIKKVAEAQALRGAFQGTFSGTYSESEAWEERQVVSMPAQQQTQPQRGKADQLNALFEAIETLTGQQYYNHANHERNSLIKHLEVESLRNCQDVQKLYKYYQHIIQNLSEEISTEPAKVTFRSLCEQKNFSGALAFYKGAIEEKQAEYTVEQLDDMMKIVEEKSPDKLDDFVSAADSKLYAVCQRIYDESQKEE